MLDHTIFHLIEGWQSREAFDALNGSEDFQAVLKGAMQLRIVERFGNMIFVSGMEKHRDAVLTGAAVWFGSWLPWSALLTR